MAFLFFFWHLKVGGNRDVLLDLRFWDREAWQAHLAA